MKSMQITNWPIKYCKIADKNFDDVFLMKYNSSTQSNYIKPFLAKKNNDIAEIIIGAEFFHHLCKIESLTEIPVYIISDNFTEIDVLDLVSDFCLSENVLNNLVISKLLYYLDESNIDEQKKFFFISKKLKISPTAKIIGKYKKFLAIDKNLSLFLISKKAPLKVWEYLTEFSENNQTLFIDLIEFLKPSLSIFLEILENLVEYQKISSETYDIILEKLALMEILQSDREDRLQFIRDKVMTLRFPTISKHRSEIANLFAEITKPNNINLQYDPTFEKKEIRGSFVLSGEKSIEDLKRFVNSDNQKKIINIIKKL